MPDRKFKCYPSGFLGSDIVPTTKPIDLEKIKSQLFDLSIVTNPDGHTANLEVVRLNKIAQFADERYKTFDFKEEVLRAAVKAFDANTILEWIEVQRMSPYFNDYHVKWIDETLMFVFAGKVRSLSTSNWESLFRINPGAGSKVATEVIKHFFYNQPLPRGQYLEPHRVYGPNLRLVDFIALWAGVPGGIDDIVASLNLLFGER